MSNATKPAVEQAVQIKLGNWKFEAFITDGGSLGFTVEHPMGGGESADIFVSKQLKVVADNAFNEGQIREEMELIDRGYFGITKDEIIADREMWMEHPQAASLVVRRLQGFEKCQDPGGGSYWRCCGVTCGASHPISHGLAVAVIERFLLPILDD